MAGEKATGGSTPRQVLNVRQFSVLVQGWRSQDEGGNHEFHGLRSLRVVAATRPEAIAAARGMLDPDAEYPIGNWAVVDGAELLPKAGDNAETWHAWHASAAPPQMSEGKV